MTSTGWNVPPSCLRHLGARRRRQVEDRDRRAPLVQQLGRRPRHPDAPPTMTAFLPLISTAEQYGVGPEALTPG